MNKVIIRTREDTLTTNMYLFGTNCAKSFIEDLHKQTYGKDWSDCGYLTESFSAFASINKNGTISICVFNRDIKIMSILEDLEDGRVVSFTVKDCNKLIEVGECCDHCFSIDLTKEELGVMIAELKELHDKMLDT